MRPSPELRLDDAIGAAFTPDDPQHQPFGRVFLHPDHFDQNSGNVVQFNGRREPEEPVFVNTEFLEVLESRVVIEHRWRGRRGVEASLEVYPLLDGLIPSLADRRTLEVTDQAFATVRRELPA